MESLLKIQAKIEEDQLYQKEYLNTKDVMISKKIK